MCIEDTIPTPSRPCSLPVFAGSLSCLPPVQSGPATLALVMLPRHIALAHGGTSVPVFCLYCSSPCSSPWASWGWFLFTARVQMTSPHQWGCWAGRCLSSCGHPVYSLSEFSVGSLFSIHLGVRFLKHRLATCLCLT